MRCLILIALSFLSPTIMAGDYMLYIANVGNDSECAQASHWSVSTAAEVSESFVQYLSGERPSIGILIPAFSNGHFHFCGSAERNEVIATLYRLKKTASPAKKADLNDIIAKVEAVK